MRSSAIVDEKIARRAQRTRRIFIIIFSSLVIGRQKTERWKYFPLLLFELKSRQNKFRIGQRRLINIHECSASSNIQMVFQFHFQLFFCCNRVCVSLSCIFKAKEKLKRRKMFSCHIKSGKGRKGKLSSYEALFPASKLSLKYDINTWSVPWIIH